MREDVDAQARGRRHGWLRLAVGIALSAGILAILAGQVDVDDVREVLVGADPAGLAIGLALYALLQAIRAARYRLLAPAAPVRVLLGVHAVHALLLRVMPMRTGELGFAWLMRRSGAAGFAESLIGVLLVRVLDLTSVLAVFAVALLLSSDTLAGGSHASTAGAVTVGAIAALAPLYLQPGLALAHRAVDGLLGATRLARYERIARGSRSLTEAVQGARRIPRRVLWKAMGLTLVQWGVNFGLIGVLLHAMGLRVSIAQAVLGGTGSVFGGLLPLAGVGNFGPLEAGWSLGFAAVGVPAEEAIASGFGFSVITFAYALLVGALGWLGLPRAEQSPVESGAPGVSKGRGSP
jgi:uncharacterized protein (TIRG00374 family)